ncbi:MAG: protein BatD [Deltaproteobacteria bacterium]|nr:protein BatD [Deltaproteobacteria bacterium]
MAILREQRVVHSTVAVALVLVAFCFAAAKAQAAPRPPEPDIQVQFDRQAFVAGEPFQVQISVTTEGQGDPQISLPQFDGFQVLRKNVSRPSSGYSFSFSFGSGQNSKQVIQNSGTTRYDIVLMAPKPGKFAIGPVKVVLDGYTFNGKSYPLEVFDGASAGASAPVQGGQPTPQSDDLTEEQLKGARIDEDYFLHMIPSKSTCMVGEQIILDVYLFTSVNNIRANQFDKEPGTEGFWVERFEDFDLRNHRNRQVVINGTLYEQVILKKLALFPLKSGKLTIAPPVFSFVVGGGGFFSFSRGKEVKRAASAVEIDVLPLPKDGRPDNFNDANVGNLSFLVDTNQKEVKVGEPVTVTVNVRGSGNIRGIQLPEFAEVDGFKIYAPETDVEVQARGGVVSGVSQSQTLFIPEKPGKWTIPSLTFSYFDLASKTYRTRTSDPIVIKVEEGKKREMMPLTSSGALTSSPEKVSAPIERMNAQMRTIVNQVETTRSGPPMFVRWWYRTLVFGVPVLFIAYLISVRVRRRAAENFNRSRSRRAESDARKSLSLLEKESELSNDQFFSRLHKILLTFLEDRLEENVVGDTMNQLIQRLSARGVEDKLARDVVASLEEYEFARFARTGGGAGERKGDIQRARDLIATLGSVSLKPILRRNGGQV